MGGKDYKTTKARRLGRAHGKRKERREKGRSGQRRGKDGRGEKEKGRNG